MSFKRRSVQCFQHLDVEYPDLTGYRTVLSANTSYESLGKILLPLATRPGNPLIFVELDVFIADTTALSCLNVLDRESLLDHTVHNRLTKRRVAWENGSCFYFDEYHMALIRSSSGHVDVEMECSTSLMNKISQMSKLHKQFFHPSSEELFDLFKKAQPEEISFDTLETLQDIL